MREPDKYRVLLLESVHPVARHGLEEAGFEVDLFQGSMSGDELASQLEGVHAIGIRSKTQIDQEVIAAASDLMVIGAFCIGTNQVALEAATERGIAVFNAPFSNTRSVAELVVSEVVMLSRRLADRVREMHDGVWRKSSAGAHEVRGKTIGVVGYGHIGSQVGVIAEAFGMRVLFYDIVNKLPMGNNHACRSLEEVLERSDFVTLHVPATPQTENLIGADELARMRPGACLLNLSRGSVVDIPALADALRSEHVGGASIDVFPTEPGENRADEFDTELRGLPNVILTPHIGGSTLEAQEAIGREVSGAIIKFFGQGATTGSVNFPQVELPVYPACHRVSNVHRNVPGVLRDLNRIVSDSGANVHAQVLATIAEIGYLIMDLDQPVAEEVSRAMNQLENTICARVLS